MIILTVVEEPEVDGRSKGLTSRRRTRGVRASRERLCQALTAAGFKTQGALAEHIADVEGLETPPRHLVNRVFREQPVDSLSLERIARALGVVAYTLYLTGADPDSLDASVPAPNAPPAPQAASQPSHPKPRRPLWAFLLIGFASVTLTAILSWSFSEQAPLGCDLQEWLWRPHTDSDRLGLVVARFDNDPANLGQMYLTTALRSDHRLMQHVSVISTCRAFAMPENTHDALAAGQPGSAATFVLRHTSAQVLLWGRMDGEHLRIRFFSARRDNASSKPTADTRSMTPQEVLQILLFVDRPEESLTQLKLAALKMMAPVDPALRQLRTAMIQEYDIGASPKPGVIKHVAEHSTLN